MVRARGGQAAGIHRGECEAGLEGALCAVEDAVAHALWLMPCGSCPAAHAVTRTDSAADKHAAITTPLAHPPT